MLLSILKARRLMNPCVVLLCKKMNSRALSICIHMYIYMHMYIYIYVVYILWIYIYNHTKDLCVLGGFHLSNLTLLTNDHGPPGRPFCIVQKDAFRSQMRSGECGWPKIRAFLGSEG